MKSIKGIVDFVLILVIVAIVFACGAGYGVGFERNRAAKIAATAPPTEVYYDLGELDKRDRQMAKRINEQEAKIKELYSRTEYLKGILEQVVNFLNNATSASPAPQGNAL
jgi:hypothetical protein